MADEGAERVAQWEFVVWSEEGGGRYSVCLHRGEMSSPDHVCLGEAVSKYAAEHAVHHANEWLLTHTREARRLALEETATVIDEWDAETASEVAMLRALATAIHVLKEPTR